ncbi:MAG TPA: serine hydrolase domain-containing protein [Candidatus Acidoferrum sp.]|nr:serine hydrolase domain-containing protein [Candidatus Acidoferrum sp.]
MTKLGMRSRPLSLGCAVLFGCVLLLAQTPKSADSAASSAAVQAPAFESAAAKAHDLTADDLGTFLDGLMPLEIEHADIAGAVVAVVKDGKLLLASGYGYADVEKKVPVSPETTLFRPGSISKLFTWTAVMQQVEQGKLDLDRDVNAYLDFKIPPEFGKPITLRDIMTHSTGFEETIKNLFVGSAQDLRPIPEYLRVHMPARIFPPGVTPAYSNYATTMAAYIVERVSGQKFDDYVEEHFFKPLNMTHATFRQPLPEALKPFMSKGYALGSGEAKPFEDVQVAPAGSLSASAVDMTHFMIMHLQNGKYGDVQILKPETAIEMHARQQGWPAAMNAMCLGFYEESQSGHRIIGHGGDTLYFHSDLHLILDSNVGFFVSYNSGGRGEINARGVLFDKFMQRYFPAAPLNEPVLATAAQDARSVAGVYELSRRFETNVLAVTTFINETKVTVNPKDNTISMALFKGLNDQPLHFREIAPMVFRDVDGHSKFAFVKDPTGRRVAYIDYPFMVLQQVDKTFDKQTLNYVIIGFSLSVIVLTLLFWPVGAMIRKHYGKPVTLDHGTKRLRMLVRLVCFGVVIYAVGLLIFVSRLNNPSGLSERSDPWLHLLQVIGLLAGLGSLVAIYNSLKAWGDGQQWFWNKIWNTFLAIGCVGFFWFIYHWHLLNFHLNY